MQMQRCEECPPSGGSIKDGIGSDLGSKSGPTAFIMCLQLQYLGQHLCKINNPEEPWAASWLLTPHRPQKKKFKLPSSEGSNWFGTDHPAHQITRTGTIRNGSRIRPQHDRVDYSAPFPFQSDRIGSDPHLHIGGMFVRLGGLTFVFAACSASCLPCCLFMRMSWLPKRHWKKLKDSNWSKNSSANGLKIF